MLGRVNGTNAPGYHYGNTLPYNAGWASRDRTQTPATNRSPRALRCVRLLAGCDRERAGLGRVGLDEGCRCHARGISEHERRERALHAAGELVG